MNIVRIILAVFIATSVAMLPVTGGALGAKSSDMSVSMNISPSDAMSVSMDMSDCCPQNTAPCEKSMANCATMANCAGNFLSFSEPHFANRVFSMVFVELTPTLASQTLRSQTSSPPFRPPRV